MGLLPDDPKDRQYLFLGLRIVGDFGATIAVPVVLFVLLGQWIDKQYNFSPWGTIVAFAFAAVLSGMIVYRKAKDYGKQYEELEKK